MKIKATVSNDCGNWLMTQDQLETYCEELALMLSRYYNWTEQDPDGRIEIEVTPGLEDELTISGLPDTREGDSYETSIQDKFDELARKAFDYCQKHYWQAEM